MMPIHFLSPNPEQKEALDELEKLIKVLEIKPSRKLVRNVRFVKSFTRALLIAGKNHSKQKVRVQTQFIKTRESYTPPKIEELKQETKIHVSPRPAMPLPPPPPPAPPSQPAPISTSTSPSGINIKGGGKSFESFVQKMSKENGMLKFNIIEPEMEPADWRIFNNVKAKLKQQIIKDPSVLEKEDFLTGEIKNICQKLNIKYSDSYLRKIKYYLIKYIKGFGKMDPLIRDSDISEITCNSYNDIKVKYKNELISTNIQFDTNEELDNFILNVAEKTNSNVSEINPQLTANFNNLKISAFYNPIMGSRFTIVKQ